MLSLLNSINDAFSPEFAGHVAARLGERQNGVSKALGGIVPIVLGAVVAKVIAGDAGLIFDLSLKAYQSANSSVGTTTGMLGILGSGTANGSALVQGEQLLVLLFANAGATIRAENAVVVAVSDYSGIKPDSANTLLGLVGAVLLGLLGRHMVQHQLDLTASASLLIRLRKTVRTMLPPELNVPASRWLLRSPAPIISLAVTGLSGGYCAALARRVAYVAGHSAKWHYLFALLASCALAFALR